MTTGIITLIVVSLLATAYLTWKLKTGGLIDSILKDPKYAGPNAIGGIMMFIGYIGLSLGLISVAGIVRVIANIALFFAVIGGPFWPNTVVGLAVILGTMGSTYWAYRTGIFAKKNR